MSRREELERLVEEFDRETLFLVYGIGGIGKSEFVYRCVEVVRESPRWRSVPAHLLTVRSGMAVEHVLAQLRVAVGATAGRVEMATASSAKAEDELAETARVLDAVPSIVFIDDVHNLDSARASEMLGYLSRHVRASRIIAASRVEVPLPPGAPVPVLSRLAALDESSTTTMVAELSRRLGIESPDPALVYARSGGLPFFVQRELVAAGSAVPGGGLDASLRELPAETREVLLLLSLARARFLVTDLAQLAADTVNATEVARELSTRFLIDTDREEVMVHDLVRDVIVRQASGKELAIAHRRAAAFHVARFQPAPRAHAIDAVEAIYHLTQAGDVDDAWELARAAYRDIAAASMDHLLLDDLRLLQLSVDDARTDIILMEARTLIRRSLIAEARDALARVDAPSRESSRRYVLLAGEVAQRLGQLREAEKMFRRARDQARTEVERFPAALQLADVMSLRGRNDAAREVLDEALAAHPEPTARDRGRWAWSKSLSYLFEERFGEGAAVVGQALDDLRGARHADLVVLLAMVGVLARAEDDDAAGARHLYENYVARAAKAGALRAQAGSLYAGIVEYCAGDLRRARAELDAVFPYLVEHADYVMACIAAYFLEQTLLAQGDVDRAIEIANRMTRLAEAAELDTLVPHGEAARAQALLAGGRLAEAEEAAQLALSAGRIGRVARWMAEVVLARCAANRGDLVTARSRLSAALVSAHAANERRYQHEGALERAAIELMGGDLNVAVEMAASAARYYAQRGRHWHEARASVALAAALTARATPTDMVEAEVALARSEQLSSQNGYPRVRARCALVRAAHLARAGHQSASREHLLGVLRELDARSSNPEVVALRAALQTEDRSEIPFGVIAHIDVLQLSGGPRYRISTRLGVRTAAEGELGKARELYDLIVEPARAVIIAERGRIQDRGRPMTCELLAALIESRGQVVTAEELFLRVWGGAEYHPLRHRNTVYVAVKRLRQTLRKLLGDREIVETAAGGWRMVDDLDAAVIRPETET